jgi:hypothetical protein
VSADTWHAGQRGELVFVLPVTGTVWCDPQVQGAVGGVDAAQAVT